MCYDQLLQVPDSHCGFLALMGCNLETWTEINSLASTSFWSGYFITITKWRQKLVSDLGSFLWWTCVAFKPLGCFLRGMWKSFVRWTDKYLAPGNRAYCVTQMGAWKKRLPRDMQTVEVWLMRFQRPVRTGSGTRLGAFCVVFLSRIWHHSACFLCTREKLNGGMMDWLAG